MSFIINENKKFHGVPLDSVYIRTHIQIGITGSVIAKPIIYANKGAYEENNKNYFKSWPVPLEKQLEVIPQLKDGEEPPKKKPKPKYETVTSTKDICKFVFNLGPVEEFKKLLPEVNQAIINELLAAGFIKDKKNIK